MRHSALIFLVFVVFCTLSCKTQENLEQVKSSSQPAFEILKEQNGFLFDRTLMEVIAEVDEEIDMGIDVPVPVDMAGGYTHERHKRNFFILQKAGDLFRITGDEKYAGYIRDQFTAYTALYPGLPLHPTNRSYATGKIFWQCLNDANWLVYISQAYDSIYEWLKKEERDHFEKNLFRPMADFLSIENPHFFNRIHNHSTWANAAVGMIGLVMNDQELIERALYGLQEDGLDESMVDNDGGYIKLEGQRQAGFLAQLDFSFSPDGHFTEGPYYLRYAMTPFLLFAKALSKKKPELEIYGYRDSILKKSVYALLNETDAHGQFFPINDAQKGMSWLSREVIAAVDIAYHDFGQDPMLLSIAKLQNQVLLDESGLEVSRDIEAGKARPFTHKSVVYTDGSDGKKGGLAILRTPNTQEGELCVVMKYAAHGLGHGHFDKLSYSLYDEVGEVIQDYGAARWVNIDQKGGGRYLSENQTFAKQSIAHNTVVINEESHYQGSVKKAEEHSPSLYFVNMEDARTQIVSAKEVHAYDGTEMHRTLVLMNPGQLRNPILVDIFRVESDKKVNIDLPLWFMGHVLSANFTYIADTTSLSTLGNHNGYQHLWKEAEGLPDSENIQLTWFGNGKFYTQTSDAFHDDELIFARPGANDPNFNLRHDPVFIQRREDVNRTVFASVIESHGVYDPVSEIPIHPFPDIQSVNTIYNSKEYTVVEIRNTENHNWTIAIANQNADINKKHKIKVEDRSIEWTGPYFVL